jgi:hypothetical protein
MKKFLILTVVLGSAVTLLTTCNKDSPDCFDRKLYRQHKGDACTDDCPGVRGCDGKFYCNECEANRQGISVK